MFVVPGLAQSWQTGPVYLHSTLSGKHVGRYLAGYLAQWQGAIQPWQTVGGHQVTVAAAGGFRNIWVQGVGYLRGEVFSRLIDGAERKSANTFSFMIHQSVKLY
jgi:hypothetical protein